MAACLVLLISSALLLRGSERALKIDPGYDSQRVAYLELYSPANLHYAQPRLLQLNRDLIRGLRIFPACCLWLRLREDQSVVSAGCQWFPKMRSLPRPART